MKERGKKARKKGTTCFQSLVPPTAHWRLACLLRDRVSSLPLSPASSFGFIARRRKFRPRTLYAEFTRDVSRIPDSPQRRKYSGALNERMNESEVGRLRQGEKEESRYLMKVTHRETKEYQEQGRERRGTEREGYV